MKKIISLFVIAAAACGIATAQQKVAVTAGADLVSSYVWRGTYNAGASFQPKLEGRFAGIALGAWGSVDFVGQQRKEVDLSLNYSFNGFMVGLTDYWWEGEGVFKYLDYSKGTTAHRWEANLAYSLPFERFPLRISWNTMFAGNDYKSDDDRAYSTYVELDYPFSVGTIDMNAIVGVAPWYSPSFLPSDNKGFSVCNLSIGASKVMKLSESLNMPLFSRVILNPATEDIHIVFGLSLYLGS